jgi:hypothetical protein
MKKAETRPEAKDLVFTNHRVLASVNQLIAVCGEPSHRGKVEEEVQFGWDMQTEEGDFFAVFDWKENREFPEDEILIWNIASQNAYASAIGQEEVLEALDKHAANSQPAE